MLSGIPVDRLSDLDSTWIEDPLIDLKTVQMKSQTSPGKTVNQYPEYISVLNLVSAQQAKINQARSEQYPGLLLNAGYQWNYNPVFKNQDTWYTTLTLRWNIFKGNENSYRVQSEIIRKSILERQAEEVEIFYRKELANREISLAEATEKIQLTRDLISTTAANLETATAEFKTGTGSMLELVDARVAYLRARQNNIVAITEYRIAAAQLERLTGINIQNK
jgi:outer membrane protein TolC